ncbi:MAG: filamentous hemagglutinin N-terminal domain-containing protein, partial [Verrucomicrobia bacterium]|nr:filamentous hemagglutinin N-terminal domain-containing protein [Verrucomicrobiota bacterium]
MKRALLFIPPLLACSLLYALPESAEVAAGQAEFHSPDSKTLKIKAADKAIINYRKFNIGEKEAVEFLQPSSKSTVLNRIRGGEPSKILGTLSANGRVFLVNPSGIYFGPNSSVNTGSFLASTLNIRDDDFLNDKFEFYQEPGTKAGSIINEGMISAGAEGFIAFMAPIIENRGSVLAKAGKVFFGAGERVILDFSGDGLIQFTVDGELKQALIENYGNIEAAGGHVEISMRTARDAIKMVVNSDGITPANSIEEIDGIIRLVSNSRIAADKVSIDGSKVDVSGGIDVASAEGKGGAAHILGENIQLLGVQIDASGLMGGGEVLIGGDYQGKGPHRNANLTRMDESSVILADATLQGDGGKVILWADETTLFDGKIYARGGSEGGNGGFVETSGKQNLGVEFGHVNTLAPYGRVGDWLLDPASITIASGGTSGTIASGSAPNCGTTGALNIRTSTLAAAATNVALCAQNATNSSITVSNAFRMAAGISISLTAGSTNVGAINLNAGITTRGAPISLTGVVNLGANLSLDTTNAGGSPAGSNITFSSTVNGARALTLNGGTGGVVTLTGAVGGTTALSSLTVTNSAALNFNSTVNITGALTQTNAATGATTFDNTVSVGSATLRGTTFAVNNSMTSTGAIAVTNSGLLTKSATGNIVAAGGFSTTGAVNLASNITTTNTALSIGGALTIAEAAAPTLTSGSGTLTVTGTMDGTAGGVAESLTLNALGGIVNLGTVGSGSTTSLTALTITNSSALNFNGAVNITGALTQTNAATGATTFSNTVSVGSATLRGTSFAVNNSLTSTGAIAVTNSGVFTKNSTGSIVAPGGFSTTGAVNLASNITTTNTALSIGGALTIAEAAAPTLTSGSGTLSITGITDGTAGGAAESLTLNALGGIINLGALGSGSATSLTSLTITNSAAMNFNGAVNITGALTQTNAATGATTFSNTVSVGSAVLQGTTFAVNNSLTSTGAIAVTNSGVFTKNSTGSIVAPGGFSTTADASLSSNITTTNTPLSIGGNLSLGGAVILSTQGAVGAGNITVTGTTNGAQSLTLTAGTGTATLTGAVGGTTPLASLTATAATVNQNSSVKTTGTVSYTGSTAINLFGNITTSGGTIGLTGPVNVDASIALDATNAGGTPAGNSISFSSTIDGMAAYTQDFSLRAGGGNITFGGALGGTVPLSNVTVVSANNWTAGAMTSASILQSAGSGTTTFNGLINTNGASGISLTGTTFNWNNNITTTGGGPLSVSHTGTLTLGSGITLNISGPYTDLGPGATVYSGGFNIITNGSNVTFNTPFTLAGSTSITTGTGAQVGNILFGSTVDGTQNLTLASASGNITFSGGIGQTTPLNVLSITSANNVTLGALSAASFSQAAGTGTTTMNAAATLSGAAGFAFTGNNLTINSSLSTALSGPANISVAGTLVLASGSSLSLDGPFTQSGAGTVQSAGSVTTTNDTILFNGALALTGNTILNTGAGIGDITFSSSVDGPGGLTLTAGTGNVTLTGAVGSNTRLGPLLINSATNINTNAVTATSIAASCTGTATLSGNYNTNAAGGIQVTGNGITRSGSLTTTGGGSCTFTNAGTLASTGNLSVDGSFIQNGAGPVSISGILTSNNGNISFLRAITETGALTLNSGTGGGTITLSSTVDGTVAGSQDLTLNAGTGNINLNGNLGAGTRLGAVTINSAANVTANGTISANSLTQSNGTGTSTFNGAITTTAVAGVSLAGAAFTLNAPITTTTGAGPATVTNSGLLTIGSGAVLTLGGGFTQNGTASTALSGSITAADVISFAKPITLSGTSSLSTAASGKDINLLSTVDGSSSGVGNLNLNAGTLGNITVSGNIGSTTRMGALVFTNANNITVPTITAASILQSAGMGTTTLGNLDTSTVGGISLSGTAFSINGNLITTALGPVAFVNSGTLSLTAGAGTSISGAFSQSGGGAVSLAGTLLTSNTNISFANAVTLTGIASLSTGAGAGDITFSSTINGAFDLNLTAGTGDILLSAAVGGTTRIGALTVFSCKNFTGTGMTAASLNITETGGTVQSNGNINTNTAAGVTVHATNIVRGGSVTATNGGPLTATFSGTSTALGSFPINAGSVSLTGTGPAGVFFGGSVTTDTGGIDIHSPVTFLADGVADTSISGGDIHFFSTVNGAKNVTLIAGAGDILFDGVVGGTTPLLALTLSSANDVTAAGA